MIIKCSIVYQLHFNTTIMINASIYYLYYPFQRRLSQEDVDRMVRESEEHADEDRKVKERIDGRNGLEGFLYNLKNSVEDKLADKIEESDKETVLAAVQDGLDWLEDNGSADKEDCEAQQKEVEKISNPIMASLYQGSGGPNNGAGDDEEDHDEL